MIIKNLNKTVNFLKKNIIININKIFICLNILENKKKIKKFKIKTKKNKTIICTFLKKTKYSYFNHNKTIYGNINYKNLKKNILNKKCKYRYILRKKIKWTFKKFKYRGKGFKIKKFKRYSKITCRLGRSHWTKLIFNKKVFKVKRTKKNTYCLIIFKKNKIKNLKKYILRIKGINKYTKRGIRLNRQFVKKRFGKISQASSVYK